MSDLNVLSVNVGSLQHVTIQGQSVPTGIVKKPTLKQVQVTVDGLEADVIADPVHHGGWDQAVYVYSSEDYDWWYKELGEPLEVGRFGENLLLSSFGEEPLKIGDRMRINDVLLEITGPRVPCGKLAARMGDTGFIKRFRDAKRPGAYARVLEEGTIQITNPFEIIRTKQPYPTVLDVYTCWFQKEKDPELLETWLDAPLAIRLRERVEFWLGTVKE